MRKIILFAGMVLFLGITLCFAQETYTITTYYPSPYGVYRTLRLFPNSGFTPGNACSNAGEMSYHNGAGGFTPGYYFCNGSTWQPLGGGAGGIPSGMIAMFDTSCPSGWTRFTPLDNKFPRGAATYGGPGGSPSHTHTIDPPFQYFNLNCGYGPGYASGYNYFSLPCGYTQSIDIMLFSSGPADNIPPYLNVVWCKKD